ncbi:MAG: N-acetylmuramoyl-L-alanine amidase [Fibrobacter sp.]|nr:N-acetylmuramoyl-L-alanine amidase [Fibrobacter sp.]
MIFLIALLALFAYSISSPIDVEAFAKQANASFHWYPVQKNFTLIHERDTAKFALNIPHANIKGSDKKLSAAPILKDGKIWVESNDIEGIFSTNVTIEVSSSSQATLPKSGSSSAEAKKTNTPPKKETAGTREVRTIVIDPGHGGKDSGALGKKAQEKDIVLTIGKLLRKELEKDGFNVKMTREKDVFIELGERANLANRWDGDLFISLHCNAIDASAERKKQIKGYHVYVLRAPESEEDIAIARRENKVATLYGEKNAKEELTPLEWFKLEARLEKYKQNSYMFTEEMLKALDSGKIRRQAGGVGGAGFMVLVGALMPAVLFEIGFISNLEDEAYMMTSKGQEDIAKRISKAITTYKEAVHNYRETLGR